MKILLSGIGGHMGQVVAGLIADGYAGAVLTAGVDAFCEKDVGVPLARSFDTACPDVDCIIDFSHHANTKPLLDFAVKNHLPLVLATTGQSAEEKQMILAAAEKIPLFFSANYSIGITLLIELAKRTAAVMKDAEIEIVETHHDRKLDAPSGTALALADAIREVRTDAFPVCGRNGHGKRDPAEIGIHSLRMGNAAGIHEVIVATPTQTVTLKHETHSRALFAEGALAAAAFLVGKPNGLYDMKTMVEYENSPEKEG